MKEKPFPIKRREIPWKNKQWDRPLQFTRPQVQKGSNKNPEEIKKDYG